MIKILRINTTITFLEYTIVYLLKTFCIWQFTNPIQWIIDLPKYDCIDRGLILTVLIVWHGIQITIINESLKHAPK